MTGDQAACAMLASFRGPVSRDRRHDRKSAVAVRATSADQPDPHQVWRDVESIMEGINGAKQELPRRPEIAPTAPPGDLDPP
jgi:hypothetical protein